MALAQWLAQVRQATNLADATFGESVTLLPWGRASFDGGGPDTTRPVTTALAIFKTTRTMPANVAPQMQTRFGAADAYISINEEYLLASELVTGDRVLLAFPRQDNPSGVYEVNYISHTPVKRSRVFLIRLQGETV
jgi:hypothetical protein